MPASLHLAECDPQDRAARFCLQRYYAELDRRFVGGFALDPAHDPDDAQLRRPCGTFVIALDGDAPVGCVALKATGAAYWEIKRLWVDPSRRGAGLARQLIHRAEAAAREMGALVLRLDTNLALPDAIAMYRHWGWREIPCYNDDPYAQVFFEKSL